MRARPRPTPPEAAAAGLRIAVEDEVLQAYLDGLAAGALHPRQATPLRIVYTAMHGVGHRFLARALRRAGFEGVAAVPTQADPDGAFRSVAFPNPEEKGAMDRALALAREVRAELVLANDPDADRLAVAVPDGDGYRMLSGNEIGFLLADDALAHDDAGGRRKLVVTTIVSSTLLGRMARDRGAAYAETLTGFKWIADAARRLESEDTRFVFGYEEALGYTVGRLVRDKDGIGAALRMAELCRALKARGRTLLDRLDEVLVAHGMSHQAQWAVMLAGAEGKQRIAAAMAALRDDPPATIGASPVVRIVDLERGVERGSDGGAAAFGRAGVPRIGRHAGDRAPQRHRAQDQVLPGAGRPGRDAGRGAGRPARPRRALRRHPAVPAEAPGPGLAPPPQEAPHRGRPSQPRPK